MKVPVVLTVSALLFSQFIAVGAATHHKTQITASGTPIPKSKADQSGSKQLDATKDTKTADEIEKWLGKSIHFVWTVTVKGAETIEQNFATIICSAENLVWQSLSKNGKSNGRATYTLQQITPEITQVSWKDNPQESNLGWVWTLDSSTGKAYGVVINAQPYENLTIAGNFSVLPLPTGGEEETKFSCP